MEKIFRKTDFICRAAIMLLLLVTSATAWAQTSASYRAYNTSSHAFETLTANSCTAVTSGTTTMSNGWYVVNSNVTVSTRITVNGTVNLILADGYSLTASQGITVNSGNTLNIYGQTSGTGALNATGVKLGGDGTEAAGIGSTGYSAVGSITIHGGRITATGADWSAGIGGGVHGGVGSVTIYGGTTLATAGDPNYGYQDAIGSGSEGSNVTKTLADGLRVTTYNNTTPVAYGNRVSNLQEKKVTVEPCTEHNLSNNVCTYCGLTIYNVTYNGNNATSGTVPASPATYQSGTTVTVLGNTGSLARTGYTYSGWNTQANGSGTDYTAGATFAISGNTTLYAKWTPITYTVRFNKNHDDATGTMSDQTFTYDAAQTLTANAFTRDGYDFVGWSTTTDGAVDYTDGQSVTNLANVQDAVVNLYARWATLYTITYNLAGGTVATPNPTTYSELSAAITLTNPTREGYTFAGWTGTGLAEPTKTVTIPAGSTGNRSYTATWDVEGTYLAYSTATGKFEMHMVPDNITSVTSSTTTMGTDNTVTWYTVDDNATVSSRIEVAGTVNLILCNDKTLTASQGLHVSSGVTLNIYAQSGGTGALSATWSGNDKAGIGGNNNEDGGNITIHGGNVTASTGGYAAGIGGGVNGSGGSFTIRGGSVTASSGYLGAGIGGGRYGSGGTITITGGTVTATGQSRGAGIGGGYEGAGGSITIGGGTVIATCGQSGSGIGGGHKGNGGTITITGGTVNATGGSLGAGIGGGPYRSGGTITITGGTVMATAGENAQAIGNGYSPEDAAGTLTLGDMKAYTSAEATTPVAPADRESICHSSYAKLMPCTEHSYSDGRCTYCGIYQWYTVTYNDNGSTGGSVPTDETHYANDGTGTVTVLGNTGDLARTGYTFDGWNTQADGLGTDYAPGATFTISGNTTLYAKWELNQLELANNASNSTAISAAAGDGMYYDVTLADRTLYRDGDWNTLCLPFDVDDFSGTLLEGATVKTLTSSNFEDGTLTMTFSDNQTSIEAGKPYIVKYDADLFIRTAADWNNFATNVNNGTESYQGKTMKLAADISVSTMVGADGNEFKGTFDGCGHTLTFNYTTDADNAAPFQWIKNATIRNLKVIGEIRSSQMFAAGFVARAHGDNAIENCVSGVTIHATKVGDGTHGGFVGRIESDCQTFTFTDCKFKGTFDGSNTDNWCPFAAWSMGNSNTNFIFNNCLCSPTGANVRSGNATFYRNGTPTLNGAYYTQTIGTAQGTNASGMSNETLASNLGDGWEISGGNVVPKMLNTANDIVNPVFKDVTISDATANVSTQYVDFVGTYAPVTYSDENRSVLFLGGGSKLYYPDGTKSTTINACRAFFTLNGITAGDPANGGNVKGFVLNFDGEDVIDGIIAIDNGQLTIDKEGSWYDIGGRKLDGKPSNRGIYIHNGKKEVVK